MELRTELYCDAESREDSPQNHPYRTMGGSAPGLAPRHPRAKCQEQAPITLRRRRYTVLHYCGGGSAVLSAASRLSSLALSASRLSSRALSPSRLSTLTRSPSRESSGFSERDAMLSPLFSEFTGCI